MEMIRAIRPTSKASLKIQCLWASNGDVDKAQKLYDFFADGLENLPENDPVPQSWSENLKDTANGLVGWFRDNQDTIAQGYEFIRNIIAGRGSALPPPGNIEPLPPINE